MGKIKKVLELYIQTDLSKRSIQRACNLPRSTVSDYIRRFKKSGLQFEELSNLSEGEIYQKLFGNMPKQHGKIRPDYSKISRELRQKNVTRQLLWEEYKAQYPEGFGYTQFCYHLSVWQKKLSISMRQIHKAGEKLFVDYSGLKGEITDRRTGQKRGVDIFVAALGASGYTYAEASENQQLESFLNSNANAFEFFEGVPQITVPDNLKSAVSKAHRYSPVINASYQDLAEHYNTVIIPARPYHPKDKSVVELAVKLVQRWILAKIRNEIFFTVEELNIRIRELLAFYNNKEIKKLKKSRKELFLELDKPALAALPVDRYEFKNVRLRRVSQDYHVEIEGSYYSVPYQLIGKEALVKYNQRMVRISYNDEIIAIHPRLCETGQVSTNEANMPQNHRHYAQASPSLLIDQAKIIGPQMAHLIKRIISESKHPLKGCRSAYGILRTAGKYKDDEAVELTAAKMLELNTCRASCFESILKRKTWKTADEETGLQPQVNSDSQNIRGNKYYH